MIWNGTDPLEPDHEVAYRGWPTERVTILHNNKQYPYPILAKSSDGRFSIHAKYGRYWYAGRKNPLDLIPLQQEQP